MYAKPLLSDSVAYALKLLICQTVIVKQVGSWLTVNVVKVHAQSKIIFSTAAIIRFVSIAGMGWNDVCIQDRQLRRA